MADQLALQAVGCDALGSPFYGELLRRMIDDVLAGGPAWEVLGPYADRPFDDAYRLRLLGGIQRLVLAGEAPDLAEHYPSAGGDGDVDAAWAGVRGLLRDPPAGVLDALTRPPQTNEVGRSVALVPGFLVVARDTGLPLSLLELGSSAGLNLRVEHYRYEANGAGWGRPRSPVRFVDLWTDGTPPLDTPAVIASRRGCDRHPIDASDPESRLTLLSYVWPGQTDRFELLRAALDVARDDPVRIDRQDAGEWVAGRLRERAPGTAAIVFHSIVWGYFDEHTAQAVRDALFEAGRAATPDAPLAWLRLEPAEAGIPVELRVTLWPGGEERLLATAGFHLGPVHWRGS
ncbi:MAG: DUF2332 domain-containing protein [Actinobacteria bacterium]|nr:DUF2332 domain-containing protein [Actinomycetota bacterium]